MQHWRANQEQSCRRHGINLLRTNLHELSTCKYYAKFYWWDCYGWAWRILGRIHYCVKCISLLCICERWWRMVQAWRCLEWEVHFWGDLQEREEEHDCDRVLTDWIIGLKILGFWGNFGFREILLNIEMDIFVSISYIFLKNKNGN